MATATPDAPPAEALELNEAAEPLALQEAAGLPPDFFTPASPGSVFDAQGRCPVVVIRPGIGKGRGRHLYEADMLRENAHVFNGWKMFVDHMSPEARKAAGGLPRSIRDLGGRLQETMWWDGLPATSEFGQGGVIGLAKPVPFVRELIESDPGIVESSISASATGVQQVVRNGQRVWLVEGIEPRGSLDWVTEAGAGGRVIPLMEAAYADQADQEAALLEGMSDDEFKVYLRDNRPELLEAKGSPEESNTTPEGGDMADITPDALAEALSSNPTVLTEALENSPEVQVYVDGLVEGKVGETRKELEEQAEARTQRVIDLHAMRDAAHKQIAESGLPEGAWQDGLFEKYSLTEGKPSPSLDVTADVDEDGTVTKTAQAKLTEAVAADLTADHKRLAEANPTRVSRRPAPRDLQENKETPEGEEPTTPTVSLKGTGYGALMEGAGIDPDKAYGLQGA